MTDVELEKENAAIAKAYKKLLKVSYQTLTKDDKKLIRSAFDVAVDAHKDQAMARARYEARLWPKLLMGLPK